MSSALVRALDATAEVLSEAMARLGGPPAENRAQQLVRHATVLSEAHDLPALAERLLEAARALSSLDSAALVSGQGPRLLAAAGPQAQPLRGLAGDELAQLLPWVSHGASSRTSGERGLQPSAVQELLEQRGTAALRARAGALAAGAVRRAGGRRRPARAGATRLRRGARAAGGPRRCRPALDARRAAAAPAGAHRPPDRAAAPARVRRAAPAGAAAGAEPAGPLHRRRLVDLDHFKQVNDERGHSAGDEVLRSTSAVLATALRAADVLHRIGGDEFAAVLEVRDLRELQAVADRMVLAAPPRRHHGLGRRLPVPPGEDRQGVVDRADAALYAAKAEGRDRACVVDAQARRG
jgi:diguanylate cyclase (GGDEF)-like protein